MNKADAEIRIEAALRSAWDIKYPSNTLGFKGQDEIDIEQERGEMFMEASIEFPTSTQSAMVGSASPHRVSGILEFYIFIPSGNGTRAATKVSDFMEETFGLKTISGIVFRTVQEVSTSDQDIIDLYRKSCAVNFTFDSFTP